MTTQKPLLLALATGQASLIDESVRMLIGGELVDAASGATFPTYNPATGAVIANVAAGAAADIDRAVQAARAAFGQPSWAKLTPAARGELLWRLADLIQRDADVLARLETTNNGRPYRNTRHGDLPGIIKHFRYHAGWATKLHGTTIPVSTPNHFVYTVREPMGVCGCIIPWNYPLNMVAWKIAPALAAGNTVILKPAEETPLTALWIAELALEAGFPPGVVNVVTGMGETAGAALVAHPDVDKIAFTGSTAVGRKIVEASAGNLKRISLELGGKSPNVIFADADVTAAARQAVWAILSNAGQNCCAGSRLFVQRHVAQQVLETVVSTMERLRVGNGLDPETQIGPLVSHEQLSRVSGFVAAGQAAGAELLLGGVRPAGVPAGGFFLAPTVFGKVQDEMELVREEIFGPVVCALEFDDWDELIARANDTPYGLAAAIWTRDINKAHRFAQAIQAGTVWVNTYNMFDPAAPFGGYKQSGYGREMGEAVYELYTQTKTIWVGLDAVTR